MLKLLAGVESRIRSSADLNDRFKWVMSGSYFCFCYVVSLRSSEGLMVDVAGVKEFGGNPKTSMSSSPSLVKSKEKITLVNIGFIA